MFIPFFFFIFLLLFICAYKAWFIYIRILNKALKKSFLSNKKYSIANAIKILIF
jgi:hypothetical protein